MHNDEKSTETTDLDTIIIGFNKLSIIDGIDEIMAQIVEIEQMISLEQEQDPDNVDNYNQKYVEIKHHLSIVQCKLKNTRIKCNWMSKVTNEQTINKCVQVDFSNPFRNETCKINPNNLQSQLIALNKKIENRTEKWPISMVVELKQLEHEAKIQQQQIQVHVFFLSVRQFLQI